MKKILAVFLLIVFAVAGCGGGKEKALTFSVGGAPHELDFWEGLAAEFTEETGIPVEVLRQPTDTDQRRQGLVIPLKSAKSDPDVFLMDVAWLAQFAASGWLEPLEPLLEGTQLKPEIFFARVVSLADRYGGKLNALPVYVDGGVLYYRKDLLGKYGFDGPPVTWRELVKQSEKVQAGERGGKPDFYGFVWQGAQYEGLICNFVEFAVSNGGGIEIEDSRVNLDTPENVEALTLMRELIHGYRISPPNTYTEMNEEEARIQFQEGAALFERNWPYAWGLHQREGSPVKGKVGIGPLPHFEGGKSVACLGGWHLGISKYSDAKEKAAKLAGFILSYDVQKRLALKLNWNPGRKDVYEDEEIVEEYPHFAVLKEVFKQAYPRPVVPYYTVISEILQRHVNAALSGKTSPEEALAAAEAETNEIIGRYTRK